ncbi:DNA-binding domain-containing protein [Aquabacterium sp.]|uniref:DNA-binding domain-containing protein n=1 Tax=Aquabacterium sp. TaxID=1872578 RepID=UPI002C11197A|nr:DNA-binding domain-containing protein [Aquabacterium sp.]HSW08519.1 DNA-binding domain-containing protein [Aquabacterium sp.]
MPALHELQAGVMDALFGRQHALEPLIRRTPTVSIAAGRRLEVYRNNLRQVLGGALAAVYPTVHELVGEAFFRGLARHYLAQHPSRSGNLHAFGEHLPGFLANFEPAATLPYLADVARLDWAWHAVFHAPEAMAVDPAQALAVLAAAPDAERAAARLPWPDTARLLASCHPVFDLWRWHQLPAESRGPLCASSAGQALLVLRSDGQVRVMPLTAGEHELLQALAAGATLGAAAASALALDPALDLAALLARYLAVGALGIPQWTMAGQ